MKTFWQVFAIARTEFRFSLRRSAPLVVTLLIGLIVGTGMILLPITTWNDWDVTLDDFSPEKIEDLSQAGYTPEEYRQLVGRFSADWFSASGALLSWNLMSIALIFVPIATVSAIPADRKFDVLEVLRSTPITGGRYLAGKILGVLAIVLLAGLLVFLLFLAGLEVVLSTSLLHLNLSASTVLFYFKLFLMSELPLLASGAVIGILTGVLFRTRRRALFPGFIAGLLSFIFSLFAFKPPSSTFPMIDLAAYYVMQNYRSKAMSTMFELSGLEGFGLLGEGAPAVGIGKVFVMYLVLLAAFMILALLARLWLRWKEDF